MGSNNDAVQQLGQALMALLANVHQLTMKARFYHWNVTGIWFVPLHGLFEDHYKALADTEDELAERLRAMQLSAPFSTSALLSLATIADDKQIPDAHTMLRHLLAGYQLVNAQAMVVQRNAEEVDDSVSADMMVELMTHWQKSMWMLRAHLDEK